MSQASSAGRTKPSTVARHLRVVELFLGLPLEHRLAHEDRQDADDALADVLGRDRQALDLDVVRLHEVADGLGDAALEAALVRAAGGRADAVDVGADRLVGGFRPLQGDFHLLAVAAGSVKAGSVTAGFCPSVTSRARNSGMPPGCVRSKVLAR